MHTFLLRKNISPFLLYSPVRCTHLAHSKFTVDATWNKKWGYCQSKSFSEKIDTVKRLKPFQVNFNQISVSILIQCWSILIVCRWSFQSNFLILALRKLTILSNIYAQVRGRSVFGYKTVYEKISLIHFFSMLSFYST